MTRSQFQIHVSDFLKFINATSSTVGYAPEDYSPAHVAVFQVTRPPVLLYELLKNYQMGCTEYAQNEQDLPHFSDTENHTYTVMIFSSPATRIFFLKEFNADRPGNIHQIYSSNAPQLLAILIPHRKNILVPRMLKFDVRVYESESEATKGEVCADLCLSFRSPLLSFNLN